MWLLSLLGLGGADTALAQEHSPDARLARVASLRTEHKPAGVPGDYVQTPFGYFPPACVQHLGRGARVLDDGSLQRADGVRERAQVCTQDNFTPDGTRARPDGRDLAGRQVRGGAALAATESRRALPPPITHDWVQAAGYNTGTPIGRIVASWTVPPNPISASGQTVYFFPGLQSDTPVILQPVLGYRGNNNTWDLSSWNCCKDDTVWYSDFIPAKAGDQIVGDTYATCSTPGRTCSSWNIDTRNLTSGRSVRLSTTSSGNLNLVVGGALEVYSVTNCDQYPPNGSISFARIGVYDYNFNRVQSPPWQSIADSSRLDVQCNYSVNTTATSATITY
ncbi:hypothetical protein [Xanthomonas theicola]|nr:hypothetical protein [Xanthomonas theicola]